MKKIAPILFLCVLYVVLTGTGGDKKQIPPEELMIQGDKAYNDFKKQEALSFYKSAFEKDPDNYEAAWKLSRTYVEVAEKNKDKKTRRESYNKGLRAAQRAVEIYPRGSKGHLRMGIALGRVALDSGPKERIKLSKGVKREVDKALTLDPKDSIAWHVLGRWNRKISTLGWIERNFADVFLGGVPEEASLDKAVECFKRAIELKPSHINHYLELGFTYEEMDRKDKALSQYRKVLELPAVDQDDKDYKEKAQARIEELE